MSTTIHPSAVVSPEAELGTKVNIGPGVIIGPAVRIGDECFIGPNSMIGEPTREYYYEPSIYKPSPAHIGARSILRTGTIVYHGVELGVEFQSGPYAVIRENTTFGRNCSLGNNCDVQADVQVGDYTRCHSNVTLSQYSKVGNYCWLLPYVILMNDFYPPNYHDARGAHVGDYCVLGGRTVVFPVKIGKHVVSAAQAVISRDVSDFSMVCGDPAERVGDCRQLVAVRLDGTKYRPYPWPNHRNEGYPFSPDMLNELELKL